ncbi:MAG: hypothetical protein EP329_12275 [Deltaproteobacteria bacterium]|nr:MAG: hypothetical protein EP329_12275 [Deltaproteobacteria bacterium]
METARPGCAVMFVGGQDEARVDGILRRFGADDVQTPVDPLLCPHERQAVAVVDPTVLPRGTADLRALAADLAGTPVVVLGGPSGRDTLVDWIAIPEVCAVVPRDHVYSDVELERALEAVLVGPRFGLDAHLGPRAVARLETPLAASLDREQVLDELAAFLAERGVRSRIARTVVDAAEELVTNALYDAPTDATGRRIYSEIDRRHAVFLGADDRPTLRAGVDDSDVVVAVHDPHGSLSLDTVKRYLVKGLRAGPDQVDDKKGGAGLGLARIFSMVDRLAVFVDPGRTTEVTLTVSLRGARRDMAHRPTGLLLAETRANAS